MVEIKKFFSLYIYIYIYIYIYGTHGLVSIIICHSTNNPKDLHRKARISEKQKNNNCKENEIFVLIISFSRRENNLFLLIGIHIINNQQIRSWDKTSILCLRLIGLSSLV